MLPTTMFINPTSKDVGFNQPESMSHHFFPGLTYIHLNFTFFSPEYLRKYSCMFKHFLIYPVYNYIEKNV